jgi:hypothetical protein
VSEDRCAICFLLISFAHTIALSTAEAYDPRPTATHPFLGIYNRTLHGVPPPRSLEVVPEYASVYFRGQVCGCEQSVNFITHPLLTSDTGRKGA